ncbi:hypothetical protein MW887_007836 [Aspergillus wentii]|nr:hypothetical protein MW887_007836 [Aspergillus wentii]
MSRTPTTRRSGRSRTGPTNYYKKLDIGDPDSDGENCDNSMGYSTESATKFRQDHVKESSPRPRPQAARSVNANGNTLPCRELQKSSTLNRLLQGRELGLDVGRKLRASLTQDFNISKSWKGASNDVIVMAWSPDGTKFAAGATAQCDEHNMLYNRGNNLLLGNLTNNSLRELPDHSIARPTPTVASHQNITDPRLFMSVTAMQWFDNTLFTASYDKTVKLWDISKPRGNSAFCFKTLEHTSKVQVMARSNFDQNILATGTNTIGLWDIKMSEYCPLELPKRHRHGKGIEFVPTSLAWGTVTATKDLLVAGMSDKEDGVPQNGLLALWKVNESSVTPEPLTPNSQNIFDIQWHPSLPVFATASSTVHSRSTGARSVVRLYDPLGSKMSFIEYDCPALDINDITFCPTNSNYVTASCTDGITYVWDYRKPDTILHKLEHDTPLNQIDENLPREQADVGVRMALWGDGVDQFYSGASDGVVKRWNVLRSPEDVHVKDMISFQEEIMCGSFSQDKSNLLVGDAAGGVHVLSSDPWTNTEDWNMNFERANESCHEVESDSESGVKTANRLLSSGQLTRHPVFGVGKGPHYRGPFAAWARPKDTPSDKLAETDMKREYQIRQLDIHEKDRAELDMPSRRDIEAQVRLARSRNQQQKVRKRKRGETVISCTIASPSGNVIDLCSDDEDSPMSSLLTDHVKRRFAKAQASRPIITCVEPEVIDLTLDTDTEHDAVSSSKADTAGTSDPVQSNPINLSDVKTLLDDDFWWPESGNIDPNLDNAD